MLNVAIRFLHPGDKMENSALKQLFYDMQSQIVHSVNPDSLMSVMLLKKVIDEDDYSRLCQVSASSDRCRDFLSHLHLNSSHPQTFVYLRLAFLDEYSWIVDEIDGKLASLNCQLQQPRPCHAVNGKCLLSARVYYSLCILDC